MALEQSRLRSCLLVTIGSLLLAGCGGDDGEERAAVDSGADVSADATTDATADIGEDGRPDSESDVGSDSDGAVACGWSVITNGMKGGSVTDVAFDPRAAGVAYALSGSKIFRSADAGNTWVLQGDAGATLARLAFPAGKAEVLIAAGGNGILRSLDAGKSWAVYALSGLRPSAILIHPAAPEKWFASVLGTGIFRSTDGGATWSIPSTIPRSDVTALVGDPANADVVVGSSIILNSAGGYSSSGTVLRTTNGGAAWDTVYSGRDIRNVRACAADAKILFAAMGAGILKSTDGGQTWNVLSALATAYVHDVINSPTDCSTVYASSPFEGIRRSTDGGSTFSEVLSALPAVKPDLGPYRMAVDPTKSDRLAAAMLDGLFFSPDKGNTWTQADVQFSLSISGMAVGSAGTLWASTSGSGVWKRSSLASPWTRVTLPFSRSFSVAVSPLDANRVFVGGWPELWRATDGATFSFTGSSGNAQGFGFDRADATKVYAATQTKGVLKSVDGGASWTEINGDLTPWVTPVGTYIDVTAILAQPNGSSALVIATKGKGIYRSINDGTSWVSASGPLADTTVSCLAAIPGTGSGTLLACVQGRGVMRSDDAGATWKAFNEGLPTGVAATGVVHDAAGTLTYLTTGQGLYTTSDLATWKPFDAACVGGMPLTNPMIHNDGTKRSLVVRSGATPMWRPMP